MEVNVKEARAKISSLLDRTQKGEEVVIVRRGKRVARLVAVGDTDKRLPDLRTFRNSISLKGEALSGAVIQGRSEERY
ncbi:MAG: type II toxin-antitoxin system prevent-host-death family antitoxin [Syntrophales bacterium]|jgi:prevent-host-death family protein|nr:type II toxin-antitoxin system prevent-host-death family antitoxin [Syntrophales bacterium]